MLVPRQAGGEHVHAVGLDGQLVPGLQGVGDSGCVWQGVGGCVCDQAGRR